MIRVDCVGESTKPRRLQWDERDTILYSLGIGAGVSDLASVTENSHGITQRVLPTFGVIVGDPSQALALVGPLDLGKVVHGAQSVRLHEPLAPSGSVELTSTVSSIWDKGRGRHAIITLTGRAFDSTTGILKVETSSTVIVRNAGGFGGDPGPAACQEKLNDWEPDEETTEMTSPDQALLYRLSGDRNPLHSDPWFAVNRGGFARPILHGLCTYGFAGRAVLSLLCANDDARFLSMSARFVAPVFPGESLRTEIRKAEEGRAAFRTWADGVGTPAPRIVLDDGRVNYLPPARWASTR